MKAKSTVAVVGEGITGLCVAYWLKKKGVDVVLFSHENDVGGTMKSVCDNGFLYETGANSALETTPLFRELVNDLQLEKDFLYANPAGKNRYILRNGKLYALPLNPISFLRTKLFSVQAKLRLLKEPFITPSASEETVAQFVERRLGSEFLEYAIDPFVAGITAGTPHELSVKEAFPKLYALEQNYGSLIKGMIFGARERKKRTEKAKDRAHTFSFLNGMQTLPKALAVALGNSIVYNASITTISRQPHHEDDSQQQYLLTGLQNGNSFRHLASVVVLATAAYDAAPIVESLDPKVAAILRSIYYSPIISLFFGFRREDVKHPLDGFGFLVPTSEKRFILGCLWNSSLFPNRAPAGFVACNAFVGGSRQPHLYELSDDEVTEQTLQDLKNIMHISGKPVYLHITRWEKSIPQYRVGYSEKLEALNYFENKFPGFYFAGNYRGGISVGDCVKNAYELANVVLNNLTIPNRKDAV